MNRQITACESHTLCGQLQLPQYRLKNTILVHLWKKQHTTQNDLWLHSSNYLERLVAALLLGAGDWDLLICPADGWGNVRRDLVGVPGGEGAASLDSDDDELGLAWVIV